MERFLQYLFDGRRPNGADLRAAGARPGRDLPGHRPAQLRPGRDGDVLHLHRVAAAATGGCRSCCRACSVSCSGSSSKPATEITLITPGRAQVDHAAVFVVTIRAVPRVQLARREHVDHRRASSGSPSRYSQRTRRRLPHDLRHPLDATKAIGIFVVVLLAHAIGAVCAVFKYTQASACSHAGRGQQLRLVTPRRHPQRAGARGLVGAWRSPSAAIGGILVGGRRGPHRPRLMMFQVFIFRLGCGDDAADLDSLGGAVIGGLRARYRQVDARRLPAGVDRQSG